MKLSKNLVQAIALGVTVVAFATSVSSCEKAELKKDRDGDGIPDRDDENPDTVDYCPACGMG